ncbi:MAG: prepilin-type N-terminal cleavage/methylation domain-containing protein [Desulfobacteraceae bacterium]|nr:prepilin-type N-terminal cleavage/methylation domain-containing protein [Desulfobacteraceae bacterium]
MKRIIKYKFLRFSSGFSLMELMVVVAIIGILSGISVSWLLSSEHRIKKVARELMGDMQKIKLSAIKSNADRSIVFTVAGYTIQDGDGTVLKTFTFTGYAQGVQYGSAGATTNATVGGGAFPAGNISYNGDILTFNSRGTCNSGWVYLAYNDVAYAVGTLSTGIIKIRRWSNGAWR